MNQNEENSQGSERPVHHVAVRRRGESPMSTVVRGLSFNRYLRALQKQLHPSCNISSATLITMNAIVNELFDKIALDARELAKKAKRSTLLYDDVVYACRLLFTSELFTSADRVGSDAVTNYRATLEYEEPERIP